MQNNNALQRNTFDLHLSWLNIQSIKIKIPLGKRTAFIEGNERINKTVQRIKIPYFSNK